MTNPTSNFGWQMPTSTDLVTDLPADFEVFGQAVDTDFVDLLGGTTGQVLSKTSNTDLDFTWVAANPGDITGVTAGTGITGGGTSGTVTVTNDMATTITAAGDIVVGTGSGTYDNLPIGTTAQVLTADTTVSPYKVKWATVATPASAMTLIKARTTFSGVADTGTTFDNLFSNTYRTYLIVIDQFSSSSAANASLRLLYSGSTQSTDYYNAHQYITWGGSATIVSATGATENNLGGMSAGANISNFTVKLYSPQASSDNWKWTWDGYSPTWQGVGVGGCFVNTARSYTGIKLFASAGNITGAVTVYGLAIS